MKKETRIQKQQERELLQPHGISGTPAGLAKSHKIIRTEQNKELQFLKLCSQIKLDKFKQERSENQRFERKRKRKSQ
ncbi:MAG: hypothetical protein JW717_13430 [Marinilabiliaceae bacterium]|nr:hypothetical protein [Marinilabiliaceae bacterium]